MEGQPWPWLWPDSGPRPAAGYHGGSYSPDGVEPVSPVSSPSLTHDKGLPKQLEELDKSHLEGDLRHKQPGGVLPPQTGKLRQSEVVELAPCLSSKGGAGI